MGQEWALAVGLGVAPESRAIATREEGEAAVVAEVGEAIWEEAGAEAKGGDWEGEVFEN